MLTDMGYPATSKHVKKTGMIIIGEAFICRDTIGVWQRRLRLCCCTGTSQIFAGRVRAKYKRDALCQDLP